MNVFLHVKIRHRMLCLITLIGFLFLSVGAMGQSVEITTTSGNIASALSGYTLSEITSLKVSGTLDARDFKVIRNNMTKCEILDLSGVTSIHEYKGYDGTWKLPGLTGGMGTDKDDNHTYPAAELPDQAFSRYGQGGDRFVAEGWWPMESLQKVILPSCINAIGDDVFRRSEVIQTILIGDDNNYFKSMDGVLYSKDGKTLQQYPFGRKGDFTLPASVTKLLKDGIMDAVFTSLTLQAATPPALDTKFTATTVWVPKGSLSAYQGHEYWSKFNLREIGTADPSLTVTKGDYDYLNGGFAVPNDEWQGWITYKKSDANAKLYIRFQLKDKSWASAITMQYSDVYDGEKGSCSFDTDGVCWIPMMGAKAEKCLWINTTDKTGSLEYKISVYDETKTKECHQEEGTFHVVTPIVIEAPDVLGNVGESIPLQVKISNTGIFSGQSGYLEILPSSFVTAANTTFCYMREGKSETVVFDSNNLAKINITLQDATFNFTVKTTEEVQNCCFSFYLLDEEGFTLPVKETITTYVRFKEPGEPGEPEEPAVSIGDTIITNNFKYEILSETTVSLVGLDFEYGLYDCTILSTVSYGGKRYNLTTIGESAFYGCDKLVKITLPDGLKTISKNAFKHCYALTSIDIPASVETIGQYAFDMDEMLTQVTLHEGLKEIGEGAFDECGVKEITIPASVTLMGYVEEGWNNPDIGILERINVQPGNTVYASVDGILYNKAKTILMHCPTDYPVKNVTLPAGIIRIVDNAMEHCGFIESIVLPEGLEVIERAAFEYCDALKSITIPSTLKEAGTYLFGTPYTEDDFCALQEIHSNHKAPGNIKMDGDPLATINKNTCALYVPKGTKALYEAAPGWKDFKNIVEEGGGTAVQSFTIGQLQYKVTAANEVMITGVTDKTPEYFDIKPSVTYEGTTYNVTAVGERAFYECSNLVRFQPERVKMPLKTIGKEAFLGCGKLTNLLLGSTLETIGDGAFIRCSSLQNLEIPAGVASIGEGVFDECVKLANIAVNSANRHYTSSNGALYNKDKTILLVCPNMRGDSYIIPNSVKRIESGAFYYCTNLKSVTLPDGLESIGDCAFYGCTGLESLTLPASLKSIGMGIVDHCEKTLKEIHSKMAQPLPLGEYPEYAFFYYSKQSDICTLYVPKGSKDNYSKAAGWKNFKRIVEEGGSMNPEVPEVTDSTLTVVWEPVAEATDYILKIYRDAAKTELIATYTFDANGKLKSTGFSYQLKGLEAGSTYYIETTAVKQANGETVILAQSTTVAETTGSSVDNEEVSVNKPQIRIGNGQIWIQSPLETEVRIYNLSGYCVCAKRISGTSSIRLSSGMYIVLIGEVRYKIVVR